jgi:hypothetical protein
MRINHDNYEEFFIAYLEGDLMQDDVDQVRKFIEANPELKDELMLLKQAVFKPDEEVFFPGKEALLKPVAENSNLRFWLYSTAIAAVLFIALTFIFILQPSVNPVVAEFPENEIETIVTDLSENSTNKPSSEKEKGEKEKIQVKSKNEQQKQQGKLPDPKNQQQKQDTLPATPVKQNPVPFKTIILADVDVENEHKPTLNPEVKNDLVADDVFPSPIEESGKKLARLRFSRTSTLAIQKKSDEESTRFILTYENSKMIITSQVYSYNH